MTAAAATALLLSLWCPANAWAQLKLDGETSIRRDTFGRLTASGIAEGSALLWDVDREDEMSLLEIGNTLYFVAPPGTYRIKCRAIRLVDGRTIAETARVTITVTGRADPLPPGPGPTPTPTPDPPEPGPAPPTPTPPVDVKNLWLLVIEETAEAGERRGQLFASKELADRMKARGHKWRVVDKDAKDSRGQVPSDLKPWLDRAKGKRLPRLYLITPEGQIVFEGDLPTTAKGLLEQLQKVGG